MNSKLESALTAIAITLGTLHETGVKVGHVAGTDFIALAESLVTAAVGLYAAPAVSQN